MSGSQLRAASGGAAAAAIARRASLVAGIDLGRGGHERVVFDENVQRLRERLGRHHHAATARAVEHHAARLVLRRRGYSNDIAALLPIRRYGSSWIRMSLGGERADLGLASAAFAGLLDRT